MIDELFKNSRLRGSSRVAQQRIHRILVVKDNEDRVVNYNYRATLSPSCFNSVGKSVINSNPDTRYPLFSASKLVLQLPILPTLITHHLHIYIYIICISLLFRVKSFLKKFLSILFRNLYSIFFIYYFEISFYVSLSMRNIPFLRALLKKTVGKKSV